MKQAPGEHIQSLAGARWGGQNSHRREAQGARDSSGAHKQKGEQPFQSMAVALRHLLVRAEKQAQAELWPCPERQLALGRMDSGDVLRNKVETAP